TISGISVINSKINDLVIYRDRQTEASQSVTARIMSLKERSSFISRAAQEQKNGIDEILRHISDINSISMSNSIGADELHADSEELVSLMNGFQKIIDEYKG